MTGVQTCALPIFMKLRYEKCISSVVFKEPTRKIQDNYLKIESYIKQLENIIKVKEQKEKSRYIELISKLDTLSPLKTLIRGYGIIQKDGNVVKSVKQLKVGDKIDIRLSEGKAESVIETISSDDIKQLKMN